MPRPAPRDHEYDDEPRGLIGSALSVAARRPVDGLAGALAAACTVMILVNALLLQQGRPVPVASAAPVRHAAETPAPQRVAPKRDDLVAQVQTALAERDLYDGVVDGVMGSETAAAIRAFEQAQGIATTGEASEKTLAALMTAPMRSAGAAARPAAAAKAPPPPPAQSAQTTGSTAATANSKLMATQRALARIGYGPVTIDGKMGAETRNAIKSFERDRGLPETGEPSPAVLRALQAMTGAPLQ